MPSSSESLAPNSTHSEVLVLGGGPAGVSCALELKDCGIDSLILERATHLGGQLVDIPTAIPNLASGRAESGKDLKDRLCRAAEQVGLRIAYGQNVRVCELAAKRLLTEEACYTYDFLFLATGYRLRTLESLTGLDKHVNDLAYRTGTIMEQFVGKRVAVVGGGESALYEALEREKTAKTVTLIVRSNVFKSRPALVAEALDKVKIEIVYSHEIEALCGNSELDSVILRSTVDDTTRTIAIDKIVAKIGYAPNTEMFLGQVEMDRLGHIKTGPDCCTSISGVFAGGDIVTPGYDRIATAMGHGSTAANEIKNILRKAK
ncbi:MAG: NAD(P)/FAD-dependent oxidoreductase [Candidatus Obscuribacterales bacterium]|nr:NAD(P)/FAD-dependent oxidoreductase [Candidatus Obscuribacterales bacterium]